MNNICSKYYFIVYSINPAITSLHNHFINNRYDGGVPQGPFLGHLEFTGVNVQKRDQIMKLKLSTLCIATVHTFVCPVALFRFPEYLHWFLCHWRCIGRHMLKTTTAMWRGFQDRWCLIYKMKICSYCAGLLCLRQRQKCRRLVCTALFCTVVSAGVLSSDPHQIITPLSPQ